MIEASSDQSRSQLHMHTSCCCSVVLLLFVCYVDTVYGFTAAYLDLIDYSYTVRCCTTYE